MEFVKKYLRIFLNILVPLVTICLVVIVGPKLLRFFMPFVIGAVIAMIANPLVRFLERHLKIVRKHSSILIIVVVLAGVIGVIYLLISKLVVEISALAADLPLLYENINREMQQVMVNLEHLLIRLPQNIQDTIYTFIENLGEYISVILQKLAFPTVSVAGNLAKRVPSAMIYAVITILSSYFFIAEREKFVFYLRKYTPTAMNRYIAFLKKDVRHLIGGYFLAQFRIMFVVAAILAVGFVFLRVDYGLFLAVLVAMLDFLPVFGTGTVLIPWAVIKLISGEYFMAAGLALLYVLTQVIRQMIQPKIVGDTMGLPPMMTLFLLYLGFKIQGLSGMILAVPVGIVVINLYHFGAFDSLIENIKILIHDINRFRKDEQ